MLIIKSNVLKCLKKVHSEKTIEEKRMYKSWIKKGKYIVNNRKKVLKKRVKGDGAARSKLKINNSELS